MNLNEDNSGFIRALFRRSVWPSVASQLASTVGPVVCASIAGLVFGQNGLAVIGLYSPFFFLAGFLGTLIANGSAQLAAMYIAKDDHGRVMEIYTLALMLSVSLASLLSFALLLIKAPVLAVLVGNSALYEPAAGYYTPTVWYTFFTIIAHLPLAWSRLMGRPGISLLLTALIAGLGIVFGALYVYVADLGLPSLAAAQAVATSVAFIIATTLLHKGNNSLSLNKPRHIREDIRSLVLMGSPLGLSKLYRFAGVFLLNIILLRAGGAGAVAIFGVLNMLLRFVTAFVNGVSGVQMPIAGVLREERDNTSLKQLAVAAFAYSNAAIWIAALLTLIFRRQVAALFGVYDEAFFFALACFCAYVPFYMNGSQLISWHTSVRHIAPANFTALAQDMLALPFCALLLMNFGKEMIWLHMPLAAAVFIFLLPLLFAYARKRSLSFPLLLPGTQGNDVALSFSVERSAARASEAAAAVSRFCEDQNLAGKQSMLLSLAIEELIAVISLNCATQNENGGDISVRLIRFDGGIVLRLRDAGPKFNPIAYCEERICSADIEESVSYMGVKYVIEAAAAVYYRETFGVNNLVVII